MNLFFDLDGTLIDAKQRVYQLFQHIVKESTLSFQLYWDIKMQQVSHTELLKNVFLYDDISIAVFQQKWHELIEQPQWLALDKPFIGVINLLQELHKRHTLYIVTARQNKENAIKQIEETGITKYINSILVTQGIVEKYELIQDLACVTTKDWIIGDTGKDIQTGKRLGINTAAVLSGFRNAEVLSKYNPDLIMENVNFLIDRWSK